VHQEEDQTVGIVLIDIKDCFHLLLLGVGFPECFWFKIRLVLWLVKRYHKDIDCYSNADFHIYCGEIPCSLIPLN